MFRCFCLSFIVCLVANFSLGWGGEVVGPLVVWQDDPSTTASIIWLERDGAGKPGTFQVVAGTGVTKLPSLKAEANTFGKSKHAVHRVKLEKLQAETEYTVEVMEGDKSAGKVRFRTAPTLFKPGFRFVTGGDMYHKRELLDAMNARAGAEDPVFALLGGDLAYANNRDDKRWLDWVASWNEKAVTPDGRSVPMVMVIGNHEVDGAGYRPKDAPPVTMADQYYSLFEPAGKRSNQTMDFGDYLSLVLLDSGHTATIASQTAWLKEALEKRKTIKRLMVCYHRPAYGSGIKTDAVDIQKEWCPLFEHYTVDVVFENDHHGYKRTYPIRNGRRDDEAGVPYLGDGAWGVDVRPAPPQEIKNRPWLAKALPINHLFRVTLTEKGFTYEAMTADGKVFDRLERPLRREGEAP